MWAISLDLVFNSALIISFRRLRPTQSEEIAIPLSQGSSISSLRSSHRTSTTTSSTWAMRSWTAPWRRSPKKPSQPERSQQNPHFKKTDRQVQVRIEILPLLKKTTKLKLTTESARKWRVSWSECLKGAFFLFNLTQYFLILRFVQVSQSDTPQNRI